MRVVRVIGRVVLSDAVAAYRGGRWLMVSPLGREELSRVDEPRISDQPSLIVYDDLGASEGDLIAITEGGEAMNPFDRPMPIDAYNACLLDRVTYQPLEA